MLANVISGYNPPRSVRVGEGQTTLRQGTVSRGSCGNTDPGGGESSADQGCRQVDIEAGDRKPQRMRNHYEIGDARDQQEAAKDDRTNTSAIRRQVVLFPRRSNGGQST